VTCQPQYVLVAPGTRPSHTDSTPLDGTAIFDTDALISPAALPRLLTIVGGVIGVEYACMYAALGIAVTLIERRPRILDFVDDLIAEALSYHMRNDGVTFRLGEEVAEVIKTADGKVCSKLKSKKQVWSTRSAGRATPKPSTWRDPPYSGR
jgi:NAD(P) transhydrogenase